MKRIVIKNKVRFITFLMLSMIIISVFVVSILEIGKVYSKSDIDYISYIVKRGDTLWDIAMKNNKKNKDLRKVVYEIEKYNNINCNISVGQEIRIPL